MKRRSRLCLGGLAVWCCMLSISHAQLLPEPAGADSIRNAFLPVVSYSSDVGLIGGVIFNRFDYRGNVRPFKTYFNTLAVASTKGYVKADARYERTKLFNRELRSIWELGFSRLATDTYFGIGNTTTYSQQLWDEEYYYFESYSVGLDVKLRKALYRTANYATRLDFLIGLSTEYHVPYILKENSSFSDMTPNGSTGGFINYLTGGFVWENRDREFNPHSGNRASLEIQTAPSLISDYGLTTFRLDLRQYFYVWDFLTIANRLQLRHAEGDIPYWELPALGNNISLRGYPLNRFRGNSSISYNLELRSWMFTFPEYQLKLGVHLFTDAGRVFTSENGASDLFRDYKQTFGFGGAISLFSPDFILRSDLGFSEEVARIYVGVGYAF